MAKKSSSSKRWVSEHQDDYYFQQAKKEGYRSRAVYKLLEIIKKKHFIKAGDKVLDLGAAPGSWSQIASQFVGKHGQLIANDILAITPIKRVQFIQGDFTQDVVYKKILAAITPHKFNVVLSDMAPNMSGHLSVDIPKSYYLAELGFEIAIKSLKNNGYFYIKLFQGDGFDAYVKTAKQHFIKVSIIKPQASRKGNKEVYLLAHQLKQ